MEEEAADAFVHQVVSDWRKAALSPLDRALCEHSVRLTRKDGRITSQNIGELRGAGLNDRAIHDATQVIAFFNYITRVADGLGVEPETFIDKWG